MVSESWNSYFRFCLHLFHLISFLPGLDVVEQVLPAVVDVLQLVIDLCLFRLVTGRDELLSELLQVGFILAEQVDLFHTVLKKKH